MARALKLALCCAAAATALLAPPPKRIIHTKPRAMGLAGPVDPAAALDIEYVMRKGLQKVSPVDLETFSSTLAGVYGALCDQYRVEREVSDEVDLDDLAEWGSETSLDSDQLESLSPGHRVHAKEMLRRSRLHRLTTRAQPLDGVSSESSGSTGSSGPPHALSGLHMF